jgi:hypothetical protein
VRGERHVWSLVRIPSVDEEDLRRSHRERGRLVREQTAHINRIKGLLFAQGIRGINIKSQYRTLAVDKLVTGDGHRLPPRLAGEIAREIQRLAIVQEHDGGDILRRDAGGCIGSLRQAIFNTDQGSQFTGDAFTGVLIKNGNAISMDG